MAGRPLPPWRAAFRGPGCGALACVGARLSAADRLFETQRLADAFLRQELSLDSVAEQILAQHPGASRLLLVVDQFEELYTLCPESEARRRYVEGLLGATGKTGRLPSYSCSPCGPTSWAMRCQTVPSPTCCNAACYCWDRWPAQIPCRLSSGRPGYAVRPSSRGWWTASSTMWAGAGCAAATGVCADAAVGTAFVRLADPCRL